MVPRLIGRTYLLRIVVLRLTEWMIWRLGHVGQAWWGHWWVPCNIHLRHTEDSHVQYAQCKFKGEVRARNLDLEVIRMQIKMCEFTQRGYAYENSWPREHFYKHLFLRRTWRMRSTWSAGRRDRGNEAPREEYWDFYQLSATERSRYSGLESSNWNTSRKAAFSGVTVVVISFCFLCLRIPPVL